MANYRKPNKVSGPYSSTSNTAQHRSKKQSKTAKVAKSAKRAVSRTPRARAATAVMRATSNTRAGAVSDSQRIANKIRRLMG